MATNGHSELETPFQVRCRSALEKMLGTSGFSAPLEHVVGSGESYFRVLVKEVPIRFEIFVYEDEAGFFEGESWHAFEAVDFDTDDELVDRFVRDVEVSLARLLRQVSPSPDSART